ncbi:MAG: hypothetical protein AB7S48_12185 [Bacteroidales bacterium]
MDIFYIDLKSKDEGVYEMHRSKCTHLPNTENRYYLGLFSTCKEAIKEAKKAFPQTKGCEHCCNSCNISIKERLKIKIAFLF